MTITVDWFTKVISVEKTDMSQVQLTPVEILRLNLNDFRLSLKDIEDGEGMVFDDMHSHNTEFDIAGLTYARTLEIINEYTVTFEDGQYVVDMVGANSNVLDRTNPNQVSVRANNAAGLITSAAIEYGSFNGAVHIDVVNGTTGTVYNRGTPENPVTNLADALLIATSNGFKKFNVIGDYTFGATDVLDGLTVCGEGMENSAITLTSGVTTAGTTFCDMSISGTQDGETHYINCEINALSNVHCFMRGCKIVGQLTMHPTAQDTLHMVNCYSGVAGLGYPTVDLNNGPMNIAMRGYTGSVELANSNDALVDVSVDLVSGRAIIAASVTEGTYVLRGVGLKSHTQTGNEVVNSDGLVEGADIDLLNQFLVGKTVSTVVSDTVSTIEIYDESDSLVRTLTVTEEPADTHTKVAT
jgi:hypothetical protein